jgi:hypothetical protein
VIAQAQPGWIGVGERRPATRRARTPIAARIRAGIVTRRARPAQEHRQEQHDDDYQEVHHPEDIDAAHVGFAVHR